MRARRPFHTHLIGITGMVSAVLALAAPLHARPAAAATKEAAAPAGSHLLRGELRRLNSLRRSADAAFRRGRMAEAEEHYREMLAVDPRSAYAQRRIGDCLLNQEQYEQALAAYERLSEMPAGDPDSRQHKAAAAQLIELARQLHESAGPLRMHISDVEKQAFSNQALREAQIHAEAHDYGAALRAAAYAESVGRDVGAPVAGEEYNELVVEAMRYHLDHENYGAVAALIDVADYLGIHSRERAELETQFTKLTKGEVQKIKAVAGPYLTALDQEVQQRKNGQVRTSGQPPGGLWQDRGAEAKGPGALQHRSAHVLPDARRVEGLGRHQRVRAAPADAAKARCERAIHCCAGARRTRGWMVLLHTGRSVRQEGPDPGQVRHADGRRESARVPHRQRPERLDGDDHP